MVILSLSIQSSLLSVFDLIMLDSWIDEVHAAMSLLVGSVFLFLSPLLSLGSSDRSHNGPSYNKGKLKRSACHSNLKF